MPSYIMKNSVRVQAKVPPRVNAELIRMAKKYGVTISAMSGMCIQAGLSAITRALTPEEAISAEKLAEIVLAMNKLSEGSNPTTTG